MKPRRVPSPALSAALIALVAATGCVANTPAGGEPIQVTSTDTACEVAADSAPSGVIAFDVRNDGSEVTEFYFLGEDGVEVIGEAEDIAPGASRTLTVTADPGDYVTLCKPGMVGDGVGRAPFSVTGEPAISPGSP